MTDPIDSERRLRAAFDDLRHDATHVTTAETLEQVTGKARSLPRWFAPAIGASFAVWLLIAGVVILTADRDQELKTAAPPHSALTTTAPSAIAPGADTPLTAASDGFFPWLYPDPILSSFEEGCQTAEKTARDYMVHIVGDLEPELSVIEQGDQQVRISVRARGEGGAAEDRTTTLTIARIVPGVVDCEAWGVVSAQAPDSVTLAAPEQGATVGNTIAMAGSGAAFEGTITLEVFDQRRNAIGSGSAIGGTAEPAAFSATVSLDRDPIDPNVIVLATTSSNADGAVPPFASVKIRHDASTEPEPAPIDPTPTVDPATVPSNFDYPVGNADGPLSAVYPVRDGIYEGPHPGWPGEVAQVAVLDFKVGDWDADGDLDALVLFREHTANTTGRFISLRLLRDLEGSVLQSGVVEVEDRAMVLDWGPTIGRAGAERHQTVSVLWRSWLNRGLLKISFTKIDNDGSLSELVSGPFDPTSALFLDKSEVPIPVRSGRAVRMWARDEGFAVVELAAEDGRTRFGVEAGGQTLLTVTLWPGDISERVCAGSRRVTDGHGLHASMTVAQAEKLVGRIDTRGDTQFAGKNDDRMRYRWTADRLDQICRTGERF